MIKNKHNLGILYTIIAMLIVSVSAAMSKAVSKDVGAYVVVFYQNIICFIIVCYWFVKWGAQKFKTPNIKLHFARGFGNWAGVLCLYVAIKHIPLVDAMVLRNTAPLLLPFCIFLFLGKKIQRIYFLPLLIGFIGVGVLLGVGLDVSLSLWHLVGLGGGVFGAMAFMTSRLLSKAENRIVIAFYNFALGTLLSLPLAFGDLELVRVEHVPYLLTIGVLYFIALQLLTVSLSVAKSVVVAPFLYLAILFSALADFIWWDHLPGLRELIGIALIVVGSLLSYRIESKIGKTVTQSSAQGALQD